MRTLKEHILEKLKVTSNNIEYENEYEKPTYQEYYDLLEKYCTVTGKKYLNLFIMYNFIKNLLPKFENDKSKRIGIIEPRSAKDKEILFNFYNSNSKLTGSYIHTINIRDVENTEVDFMEDKYVEATVKYMKEQIKKI